MPFYILSLSREPVGSGSLSGAFLLAFAATCAYEWLRQWQGLIVTNWIKILFTWEVMPFPLSFRFATSLRAHLLDVEAAIFRKPCSLAPGGGAPLALSAKLKSGVELVPPRFGCDGLEPCTIKDRSRVTDMHK
jgi:hypothetical protein